MKCCVSECNNEATIELSNNLINGYIPFCKSCSKLFEVHQKARDNGFFEDGVASASKNKKEKKHG